MGKRSLANTYRWEFLNCLIYDNFNLWQQCVRVEHRDTLDHALEKLFTHTHFLVELPKIDAPFFPQKSRTLSYSQLHKARPAIQLVLKEAWSFCNDWAKEKKLLYLAETLNLGVFSKNIEVIDPILWPLWTDFVPKENGISTQ